MSDLSLDSHVCLLRQSLTVFVVKVRPLRGATIPKPFNLSTGHKKKTEEVSAYVPMAERIVQYQNRTPERYHLRSRMSQARGEQLNPLPPHSASFSFLAACE